MYFHGETCYKCKVRIHRDNLGKTNGRQMQTSIWIQRARRMDRTILSLQCRPSTSCKPGPAVAEVYFHNQGISKFK